VKLKLSTKDNLRIKVTVNESKRNQWCINSKAS